MTTARHPSHGNVHDVAHRRRSTALDALFAPTSIAVVGATEKAGSVGRAVLVHTLPQIPLDFEIFGDRFDNPVRFLNAAQIVVIISKLDEIDRRRREEGSRLLFQRGIEALAGYGVHTRCRL